MKNRTNIFQVLLLLSLVALTVWTLRSGDFAGGDENLPSSDQSSVPDGDWELVEIAGSPLLEGTRISLSITPGQMGGFSGCNQYGGPAEIYPDGTLQISEIASTAMACLGPEGVMEQEAQYFQLLAASARFIHESDRLVFLNPSGVEILAFNPVPRVEASPQVLESILWELIEINGTALRRSDPPVQARFEDGVMMGFSGCRHYIGTYVLEDDHIRLQSLEMMPEDCSPDSRPLEDSFLETTDLFERYRMLDGRLEIDLQTGSTMVFVPLETETDYDLTEAEIVLRETFDHLASGDFATAADTFSGPREFFDVLRDYNPGVDTNDPAALLEAGCTSQFFCMPVLEVVEKRVLSDRAALFRVTFQGADGRPFQLGACCGGDDPDGADPSVFSYLVRVEDGRYSVFGGLVYVP